MVRSEKRADDKAVNLISNTPGLKSIGVDPEGGIPDRYEFELIRLRRRVADLECVVRDRDDRIVKALGMLEDELQFWRSYLNDHVGETLGRIMQRVIRLESALAYLKDKDSRFYPPLEPPAQWRKKSSMEER